VSEPCAWELSSNFISLPLLKNGTAFLSTETKAPVRGFRPVLPARNFVKNTPNPRSSTRSPRAIAAVISAKMVLTIFSAFCRYRCGFWADIRSMSSDLITAKPPSPRKVPRIAGPVKHPFHRTTYPASSTQDGGVDCAILIKPFGCRVAFRSGAGAPVRSAP
jgi:hypothetical protein